MSRIVVGCLHLNRVFNRLTSNRISAHPIIAHQVVLGERRWCAIELLDLTKGLVERCATAVDRLDRPARRGQYQPVGQGHPHAARLTDLMPAKFPRKKPVLAKPLPVDGGSPKEDGRGLDQHHCSGGCHQERHARVDPGRLRSKHLRTIRKQSQDDACRQDARADAVGGAANGFGEPLGEEFGRDWRRPFRGSV